MRQQLSYGVIAISALGLVMSDSPAHAVNLPQKQHPQALTVQKEGEVDWAAVAKIAFDAEVESVNLWKLQAKIYGTINTVILSIRPGGLEGPALFDTMKNRMIANGVSAGMAEKFSRVFNTAWSGWAREYRLAGIPAYPAFAAFPSSQAPPTPNTPFPLGAGVSQGAVALTPFELEKALKAEFSSHELSDTALKAIRSFSAATAASFAEFLTHDVTFLMGKGPVPSFAPPYIPVGPVVMGDTIATPGILALIPYGASGSAIMAFDGQIGQWKVRLENGKSISAADHTSLAGTIIIRRDGWPTSFRLREAKLVLKNMNPMTPTGIPLPHVNQNMAVQSGGVAAAAIGSTLLSGQAESRMFNAAYGSGTIEIITGATVLTYPTSGVAFAARADGSLEFSVDTFASDVCRIKVGPGGFTTPGGMRFPWNMTCPNDLTAAADLTISPSGLSGSGNMKAFGANFTTAYTLDTNGMRLQGIWAPSSTSWRNLPGFEGHLQYSLTNPSIRISFTLPSRVVGDPKKDAIPKPNLTFNAGSLSLRSKATRPNGTPWVSSSTPGLSAQLYLDGTVRNPFPRLPQPTAEASLDPLCRATCDYLAKLGISGITVPRGPMKYNSNQSRCEVPVFSACGGPTTCTGGFQLVDEGGKKKCRLPLPNIPQPPNSIKVRQLL